jgi:hypothetical protein
MDHSSFPCLQPPYLKSILLAPIVVVVAATPFCHTDNLRTIRNLVAHCLLYSQRLIASFVKSTISRRLRAAYLREEGVCTWCMSNNQPP